MKKLVETIKGLEQYRDAGWTGINDYYMPFVADALELLKTQESRHRLEVHNIGNVDIPEGVSWEQFHAVMNNVVDALEHTDRGESWPYEEAKA